MLVGIKTVVCCLIITILRLHNVVQGEVFTSTEKMREMFLHEKRFLSGLKRAIQGVATSPDTQTALQFCENRLVEIKINKISMDIKHPNAVYLMIKNFTEKYRDVRQSLERINLPYLRAALHDIPSTSDLQGAVRSLLRLQDVYKLTTKDMIDGQYLGHSGPLLDAHDAYEIGLAAFKDNQFRLSAAWFKAAHQKYADDINNQGIEYSDLLSLLQESKARAEKNEQDDVGTDSSSISTLFRALNGQYSSEDTDKLLKAEMKKVHNLCAKMDWKYTKTNRKPICRYRAMLLPYYRLAEEVLSTSPFASLVYNITNHRESNAVRKLASRQLYRAEVHENKGSGRSDYRTSHVAFVEEKDSKHLSAVTTRISYMTGLQCDSRSNNDENKQRGGERYQVVNYGIGGHYSVHLDTYEPSFSATKDILQQSGNRIATVLIYLSPVEAGGSTVFPWLNIAVPPLQHSALVWFNMDKSGTVDFRTRHAGCPVIVGDKWVMNKWILSHANTFTRPCGRHKTENLQKVEKMVTGG